MPIASAVALLTFNEREVAILTAIAVQTLQRSEAFSDSGWQNTSRLPMPPAFHLVPLRHEIADLVSHTARK